MARDFNGSTDRLDWSNIYDPTYPEETFTFFCHAYFDVLNTYQYLININDIWGNPGLLCWNNGGTQANSLQITRVGISDSIWKRWFGTGAPTTGSWHRLVFTADDYDDPTNWDCKVNGTTPSSVSSSSYFPATEWGYSGTWSLGGRTSDDNRNLNGRLAECAWWDRVLDADEIAALNAGYSPDHFLRGLRFYTDLFGRTLELDRITGTYATHDGTTKIEHPRVFHKPRPRVVSPAQVAIEEFQDAIFSLS